MLARNGTHGDDIFFYGPHGWPQKAGGLGGKGGVRPPTRICKQNDPFGDDLMLCFLVQAWMALNKRRGWGGHTPLPFANTMIRTAFP